MPRSRSTSSLHVAGKCTDFGDSMMGKLPARSRKQRKRGASKTRRQRLARELRTDTGARTCGRQRRRILKQTRLPHRLTHAGLTLQSA